MRGVEGRWDICFNLKELAVIASSPHSGHLPEVPKSRTPEYDARGLYDESKTLQKER